MTQMRENTDFMSTRALLALWVFIYHVDLYLNFSAVLGPAAGVVRRGYLAVDAFFILSGLIMARAHPELLRHSFRNVNPFFKPPSFSTIWRFWARRLGRVYPVHLATIGMLAVLYLGGSAVGIAPHDPGRFSGSSLIENLFMVHAWGFPSHGEWNYPSWSLSAEWAGYLVFPIMWYMLAFWPSELSSSWIVLGTVFLGFLSAENNGSMNFEYQMSLVRFFPEFVMGMAISRTAHNCADFDILRQGALKGGAVLTLVCLVVKFDMFAYVGLAAMLWGMLLQEVAEFPPVLPQFAPVLWLGRISYSFYMSFAIAELVVTQCYGHLGWAPQAHGWLFAAAMFGLTLALATVLNVVVEVPCRRAVNRWLDASAT